VTASRLVPLAVLACLVAGCAREAEREPPARADTPATVVPREPLRPERTAGVVFDPLAVKPGDAVGTLQLAAIEANRAAADTGTVVGRAAFIGELALSGSTLRHFEPDVRAVCFEADLESARRMPRWRGDERRPWFCFRDTDDAARRLAQPGVERPARLIIADFTIVRGLSDEVNEARLVRVLPPDSSAARGSPR
jgi:hypothetical protein